MSNHYSAAYLKCPRDDARLDFTDLWGRWPTLIDWQNVFCEVSKQRCLPTAGLPAPALNCYYS